MIYRVKTEIFEGPFDLLLFLIRKHEIDIYDIPIHDITNQFLEYIKLMKILDLEVAGEFIEMVASLMNIKARMLLPKPVFGDEDDVEDPRTELVQRLLEYKKFKEAASEMSEFEEHRRKMYSRKFFLRPEDEKPSSTEEYLQNVTLFDLLLAFKKALDNMPKVTYHEVKKIEVTIEEQTEYILNLLDAQPNILFSEFIEKLKDRIVIIVTFLALLDLIKLRKIIVRQSRVFDDIKISS
ncbi:MAG: segregation/condensation protein A, partial [Calditrichia bacterium]|nr:segregation/condensation protein A [Calditrichia bacterium]